MSDVLSTVGGGASDGRWYPPETHPAFNPPGPQAPPPGWWKGGDDKWYPPHLHPDHVDVTDDSERKLHRRALAVTWIAVLIFAGAVGVFLIRDSDTPPVQVDSETIEQSIPPETVVTGGNDPSSDPTDTLDGSTTSTPTTTSTTTPVDTADGVGGVGIRSLIGALWPDSF